MDVSKRCILLLGYLLMAWQGNTQDKSTSFSFELQPLAHVVQSVVKAYGLYVSYDPKIFKPHAPLTISFEAPSIQIALQKVLGDDFDFRIINEYVVITPNVRETPPPVPTPKVVHDTVYLQETQIRYDTILVEKQVEQLVMIYDTTYTEKEIICYDTVKVTLETIERNWHLKAHFAPHRWYRENKYWTGWSVGASYQHQWKRLSLETGITYYRSATNISYTRTESRTLQRVDTVSVFYIVEGDDRIPQYITDTTYESYDYVTETYRTNTVDQLSLSIRMGQRFKLSSRLQLQLQAGMSLHWIIQADEINNLVTATGSETVAAPEYRLPLVNLQVELPMSYSLPGLEQGYFLSPFAEWGVNSDHPISGANTLRLVAGIKLGLVF